MTPELLILILASTIQAGTPILYATLGEIVTERAGVLNLGVEGMMIMGAFFAFIIEYYTGNSLLACLGATLGVGLFGSIHALVCVVFQGNQTVSGLAITILGLGLANYLGNPFLGTATEGIRSFAIPFLCDIPLIGTIFFNQDALVYLSYFLPFAIYFLLSKTAFGLALCAVGESPGTAETAGINSVGIRIFAIFFGAALVGLGGAYLSLSYTHIWTSGLTAGRGWIAIALVIFSFWKPERAILGAYLFGGVMAMQLRMQAIGTTIPSSILLMLPYLLTILTLLYSSALGKASKAPAALGINISPRK